MTKRLYASKRAITVSVTQQEIDTAAKADSSHCMIADAIQRTLPECRRISVDLATIRFTDPSKKQRYIYLTPSIAQVSLVRFDQALPVTPFIFKLTSPAQVCSVEQKKPGEPRKKRTTATAILTRGNNTPVKVGGAELPRANLGKTRRYGIRTTTSGIKMPQSTEGQ